MSEPTRRDLEPVAGSHPAPVLPGFIERMRDAATVQRVFGDPIVGDGVTVIPAASVVGGGGGGTGTEPDGREGNGGGFGLHARPVGALVIRGNDARWEPAVDPERRLAIAAAVAVVGVLALRSLLKPRRRRRRRG